MAQEQLDVFKIFKDIKNKILGIDPKTQKEPVGFFVTLNAQPQPVSKQDFDNPVLLSGQPTRPFSEDVTGLTDDQVNERTSAYLQRSQDARRQVNVLVDKILEINPQYENIYGNAKISDAWQAIIKGATAVAETKELNAQTKQQLDKALKILTTTTGTGDTAITQPSPQYLAYRSYKEKHDQAVLDLSTKYAEYVDGGAKKLERWQHEGKVYQSKVTDAENDWESFGFKSQVESALYTQSAQGVDPSAFLISMAKNEYEKYDLPVGEGVTAPYIEINPGNWYDKDTTDGWEVFTSKVVTTDINSTTSSSSAGANGHYFFYVQAKYADSTKNTDIKIETSSVEITCGFKTVLINYPWIDAVLLRMGGWFLSGDHDKFCISDGTANQKSDDPGRKNKELFFPSIPTQMILIKNLSIKCKMTDDVVSKLNTVKSGGGGISFMGFGGGVSKKNATDKQDHKFDSDSESLTMDGVYALGYYCAINSPSPMLSSKDFMSDAVTDPAVATAPATS